MSINSKGATSLTGLDWRSRLKEVVLDALVWQKLIQYSRTSDEALRPAANKFFSLLHPDPSLLGPIISLIVFVEMTSTLPATTSGLPEKLLLDQAETKAQ